MWTIDVRLQGDLAWLQVWAGGGGGSEEDARRRYEQVRERINGRARESENVHAERWVAARLSNDGVVAEDHRAGVDDTQPSLMATQPPDER